MKSGFTIWLTGPPAAGKTTLAGLLAEALEAVGTKVEIFDGDVVRRDFFPELGFSRDDRRAATMRTAKLARLLNKHGVCCIVAQIAPYSVDRLEYRRMLGEYIEVHMDCSLEQRINRDPKGLYAKALAGEVKGVTGFDDPYEAPEDPEVHCCTDRQTPKESAAAVISYLLEAGLLDASAESSPAEDPAYTPEQEKIIRKRLADLGYI